MDTPTSIDELITYIEKEEIRQRAEVLHVAVRLLDLLHHQRAAATMQEVREAYYLLTLEEDDTEEPTEAAIASDENLAELRARLTGEPMPPVPEKIKAQTTFHLSDYDDTTVEDINTSPDVRPGPAIDHVEPLHSDHYMRVKPAGVALPKRP